MAGLIKRQRHRMKGKWTAWSAVESEKDRMRERERERESGSRVPALVKQEGEESSRA